MTDQKKNKFAGVADRLARQRSEPELPPPPVTPPIEVSAVEKKPSRAPGKKSNKEDFVQVTVYLRKTTHTAARKLLLDQDRRQFSDLVEELVSHWINRPDV